MAVNYRTSLKTTRMTSVRDDIDGGAGAGILKIGTAGMASVLAEITLADPCGTVATDTLTFDFDPDVEDSSANNSGTAAEAVIYQSDGTTAVVSGLTVGTSGANINLVTVTIVAGQPVRLTTGTIQHG
jgi:hypothetical protein